MKNEMNVLVGKLRELGASPEVLSSLVQDLRSKQAPPLTAAVITRLRGVVSKHNRAMITLGRNGGYTVFTPEGHAALQATARKYKPWNARSKSAVARA